MKMSLEGVLMLCVIVGEGREHIHHLWKCFSGIDFFHLELGKNGSRKHLFLEKSGSNRDFIYGSLY